MAGNAWFMFGPRVSSRDKRAGVFGVYGVWLSVTLSPLRWSLGFGSLGFRVRVQVQVRHLPAVKNFRFIWVRCFVLGLRSGSSMYVEASSNRAKLS